MGGCASYWTEVSHFLFQPSSWPFFGKPGLLTVFSFQRATTDGASSITDQLRATKKKGDGRWHKSKIHSFFSFPVYIFGGWNAWWPRNKALVSGSLGSHRNFQMFSSDSVGKLCWNHSMENILEPRNYNELSHVDSFSDVDFFWEVLIVLFLDHHGHLDWLARLCLSSHPFSSLPLPFAKSWVAQLRTHHLTSLGVFVQGQNIDCFGPLS